MIHRALFFASLFVVFAVSYSFGQIKSDTLTIRQIQEVHPDTLAKGVQNSPRLGDTITVTGIAISATRAFPGGPMLNQLGNAYTVYIVDEAGGPWSGLNVRATDSVASASTFIAAVDTGAVIRITGVVTQFFTTTQFEIGVLANRWNADIPIEILDTKPQRPNPTEILLTDLVKGGPQTGIPTAQQWEGAYVTISNLRVGTVTKNPSTGRFTWTVTDDKGNSIGVYDQSIYFRGGSAGFDPNWEPPVSGTEITFIRGIITSSSQGIIIAPLYLGDIALGSFPPVVKNLRRDKGIPTSTDKVIVTCEVEDSNPTGSISSVKLTYGSGSSDYGTLDMNYDPGTKEATVEIPAHPDGTVIWYYITATDNSNETVVYPGDINKARPFYIVRDGATRIRDVQYTPYSDGVSGALGFTVTVRGTVVSDTSLGLTYIQDNTESWSGIMIRGGADIRALSLGDDVTITGKVQEGYSSSTNSNTVLNTATIDANHGKASVPSEKVLQTVVFQDGVVRDGNPDAEQWEGMLVRFDNLTVTASNADAAAGSNFGEFVVSDGSGNMRVDDIGSWKTVYTNDSTKTSLIFLKQGTTIQRLTGIMFFSFGNYKLQPRTPQDFQNVTSVRQLSSLPEEAMLGTLYPNPISHSHNTMTIPFSIAKPGEVRLSVVNLLGQEVDVLANVSYEAGKYEAQYDGHALSAGSYLIRLVADGRVSQRLMVRIK